MQSIGPGGLLIVEEGAPAFEALRLRRLAEEAINMGDAKRLGELFAAGLSPNHSTRDYPPLMRAAASSGKVEILRAALDAGGDPEGVWPIFKPSPSPLAACIWTGSIHCVELLLSRGADPDGGGLGGLRPFPVVGAANGGRAKAMRVLAEAGAKMDVRCEKGKSALMHAVEGGSPECVRICLEFGADPDYQTERGLTAAMHALDKDPQCMLALCEFGFDVGLLDGRGRTLAQIAAEDATDPAASLVLAWMRSREESVEIELSSLAGAQAAAKPRL